MPPTVTPDAIDRRFTRWRSDRQFSEPVRHRAGGAGPNTTFCRPAGTFYRGGAGRRRRNCTRCADRVASSPTRCCRLSNAFARHAECITVHAGLVPVTIGLIAARALIIVRDRSRVDRLCHHGSDRRARLRDPDFATASVRPARQSWSSWVSSDNHNERFRRRPALC